jgi:imidazolonepropionase-like amidohydrolase
MLILKNCRLLDELTEGYDGDFSRTADIYVEGGKILKIMPAGVYGSADGGIASDMPGHNVSTFSNGTANGTSLNGYKTPAIIDCRGMTALPAFIEMHSHLYSFGFDENKILAMTDGEVLFRTYDFAREYLKAGYTTVRDCGSINNAVAELKKARDAGILTDLPRLISCGDIITPTETGNDSFRKLYREADGSEEMRKAARQQFQKGNDFIKLMVSGAFLNEGGDPGQLITTDDEIRACVEIADMKDSYVCAHCHGTEAIKAAIRCGVRTIEHGVFIDEEGIEMLKESDSSYLVPTAAITEYCVSHAEGMSDNLREQTYAYYEIEKENIQRTYNAGLKLGFGSDIDMTAFMEKPGFEFIARKEYYGFSEKDILKQATKDSAIILGIDDKLGTLASGKLADIVLIDGRPDENIYALGKAPALVIMGGAAIGGAGAAYSDVDDTLK